MLPIDFSCVLCGLFSRLPSLRELEDRYSDLVNVFIAEGAEEYTLRTR